MSRRIANPFKWSRVFVFAAVPWWSLSELRGFRSLARSASSVSRTSCSNLRALVSWLALVVDYLGLRRSACARADCKQLPLRGARAAEVPEHSFVSTVLEASPCSPVSAFREALETPAALVGGIAVESQASLDIVGPWKSSDNPGVGEFS